MTGRTLLTRATEVDERIHWTTREHGRFPTRDELLALREVTGVPRRRGPRPAHRK